MPDEDISLPNYASCKMQLDTQPAVFETKKYGSFKIEQTGYSTESVKISKDKIMIVTTFRIRVSHCDGNFVDIDFIDEKNEFRNKTMYRSEKIHMLVRVLERAKLSTLKPATFCSIPSEAGKSTSRCTADYEKVITLMKKLSKVHIGKRNVHSIISVLERFWILMSEMENGKKK